jgi:hypothetical protein
MKKRREEKSRERRERREKEREEREERRQNQAVRPGGKRRRDARTLPVSAPLLSSTSLGRPKALFPPSSTSLLHNILAYSCALWPHKASFDPESTTLLDTSGRAFARDRTSLDGRAFARDRTSQTDEPSPETAEYRSSTA